MQLRRNTRYDETTTRNLLTALRKQGEVTLKDIDKRDARTAVFFENFKIGNIKFGQFMFTVSSKPYPEKVHKVLASL